MGLRSLNDFWRESRNREARVGPILGHLFIALAMIFDIGSSKRLEADARGDIPTRERWLLKALSVKSRSYRVILSAAMIFETARKGDAGSATKQPSGRVLCVTRYGNKPVRS